MDPEGEVEATFALERFSWDAPDCLVVRGTFAGLGDRGSAEPTLVVHGADREVRLPAAAETLATPPEDGEPWQAKFVWQEPPIAFRAATLVLGDGVAVELPELGSNGRESRRQTLRVRHSKAAAAEAAAPAVGSVERLRLEADLLDAREQMRELEVAVERANAELARTRADLEAERERNAADAKRFRENLARVSGSIEEVLTGERETSAQLRRELDEAQRLLAGRDAARAALAAAQEDAESLVARLTTLAEALGPPR